MQRDANERKCRYAADYRSAHEALIVLDMNAKSSTLQPLTEEDMYHPLINVPHELDVRKKTFGWI